MRSYSICINKTLAEDFMEIQEIYLMERWCYNSEIIVVSSSTTINNEDSNNHPYKSPVIELQSNKQLPKSIKMTHHFVSDEKEASLVKENYKNAQCIYSKSKNIKNDNINVKRINYASYPISIRDKFAGEAEISIEETGIVTCVNENSSAEASLLRLFAPSRLIEAVTEKKSPGLS